MAAPARPGPGRRPHVLFLVDDVSLAQVVRLRTLAGALDPGSYRVSFASARFEPLVFAGTHFEQHPLPSISAAGLERRLALGLRPYDRATLEAYVRDELALLERLQPDLVVGDLRLSLCISAAKLGVPHAALINAYWNPDEGPASFPVPEHPLVTLLGHARVAPRFHRALPWVLEHFAAPVNELRRRHGLAPIGNLIDVLTHGDHVLYPDVPELTPVTAAPENHRFIGPVLWSPGPGAAGEVDPAAVEGGPLIYVTLGSSGSKRAERVVFEALGKLGVRALLSTAGRPLPTGLPANIQVRSYVDGEAAVRQAALVICNGGSGTAYQALHAGTPVLGLPSNLDQYLCMAAIERAGAGRSLRAESVTVDRVVAAIRTELADAPLRERAAALGAHLRRRDSRAEFCRWLETALGYRPQTPEGLGGSYPAARPTPPWGRPIAS